MVETLGSQLRHARLGRGLSLEDAAHATKVRAPRLSDLENDVYTNFPNIAYARSFLVIYGKFLQVDVTPYLDAFEDTNSFGLDDYQYLSEQPVAQYRAVRRESIRSFRPRRHARRRLPVRVPALLAACLALGLGAWYLTLRFRQLGSLEQLAARQESRENPAPSPAPAAEPEEPAAAAPVSSWSLTDHAPVPSVATSAGSENTGAPASELLLASNVPPATPTAAAAEAPKAVPVISKQVTVRPLRKTYVTVVVNDPSARPAYEDWVAPGARPLSFRGDKFFVHVLDKGSVEISKDGVVQPQGGTDILIE